MALGPKLMAEGLVVVGLDVIGDYLTEINVTSPTCFVEITEQSGFDVGGMFADALIRNLTGGDRATRPSHSRHDPNRGE